MELTFTGRDLQVTDEIRQTAQHKLSRLERMEPRTMRVDLKFIGEHHSRRDGVKRIEAAWHIPRKTFRAHAEADNVPSALDLVAEKLERQIRDHHGKRRAAIHKAGLESAHLHAGSADTEGTAEGSDEGEA